MVNEAELRAKADRAESRMRAWTASLPPYNRETLCPKCAFDRATTEYEDTYYVFLAEPVPVRGARMKRICPNCRYEWSERPLDTVIPS